MAEVVNTEELFGGRCAVCGKPLTEFGNKKLSDGSMLCRNCAKKASQWLSDEDYQNRSVEDIKKHLTYREENRKKLETFVKSRVVEGKYSLYIDDENRQFAVSKRDDINEDNADVFSFDEIEDIKVYEQPYQDQDSYDIFAEIKVKNPEVGKVLFRVNEFNGLTKDSVEYQFSKQLADKCCETLNEIKEQISRNREEEEMPVQGAGRKKHVVEGNVAEIKKSEEGLNLNQVGEKVNFLTKIINIFKKGK